VGPTRFTIARGAALWAVVLVLLAGGARPTGHTEAGPAPIVVLIAIDGWRWDYLDRMPAPALRTLAARGVRAESLVPVFPALTFPNHYTIVTGLRPAHHGIISNTMLDPRVPGRFTLADTAVTGNPAWWSGEPIWHTATRQGLRSATMFWPGSDVAIGGRYPTYWRQFQDALPAADRTRQVIEWLRLPEAERPAILTLYFSDVDTAGHTYGPEAPEVSTAVARVDAEVARLLAAAEALGLSHRLHLIVVSDHGMTPLSGDRVIVLDDYLDPAKVQIVDIGSWLTLNPTGLTLEAAYEALANRHPRLRVYRSENLPDQYGLAGHPRLAKIVGIVDEGWTVTTRDRLARRDPSRPWGGAHGFDPALRSMHGLLVAAGPRLREGLRMPSIESIHVYALMCELLGIVPAPNDGDAALIRPWLR
jgi:predicted AlkP superfamily pyrophosphatase or phosphodiesterase